MTLIIGGAYQGKLRYALEHFAKDESDVFKCSGNELDLSKDIICGLHQYILELVKAGDNPVSIIENQLPQLKNKIIICDDIFCGIVPTDSRMRLWREYSGRCLALLSQNSDEVIRIFCGLEYILK